MKSITEYTIHDRRDELANQLSAHSEGLDVTALKWFKKGFNNALTEVRKFCPCGGIILADTEDWSIPMCYECVGEIKEGIKKEGL